MAVYKMIRIRVHDADRYAAFAEAAAAATARHGGELLFQNERDAATRILLVRFPDADFVLGTLRRPGGPAGSVHGQGIVHPRYCRPRRWVVARG